MTYLRYRYAYKKKSSNITSPESITIYKIRSIQPYNIKEKQKPSSTSIQDYRLRDLHFYQEGPITQLNLRDGNRPVENLSH